MFVNNKCMLFLISVCYHCALSVSYINRTFTGNFINHTSFDIPCNGQSTGCAPMPEITMLSVAEHLRCSVRTCVTVQYIFSVSRMYCPLVKYHINFVEFVYDTLFLKLCLICLIRFFIFYSSSSCSNHIPPAPS